MPNAFLEKQRIHEKVMMDATQAVTQQMMMDTAQIALHEAGWGYDRILRFCARWGELYNRFHDALMVNDAEADVLQEHLDRALGDIIKNRQDLIPFRKRYPEIKEITYSGRKGKGSN